MLNRFPSPTFYRFLLLIGILVDVSAQEFFWDSPRFLARQTAAFPLTTSNSQIAYGLWQEKQDLEGKGWPNYHLSLAVKRTFDTDWVIRRKVLGPFVQTGDETQIFSAVVASGGRLWVAVLSRQGEVRLYSSDNDGQSFVFQKTFSSDNDLLAPRLFLGPQDQPILLINSGSNDSFHILSSRYDGLAWSDLSTITDDKVSRVNFKPFFVFDGRRAFLVYQALLTSNRPTYQIYLKTSQDGGRSWSQAVRLSSFSDEASFLPDALDNQRPFAFLDQERLYLTWEKRAKGILPSIEVAVFTLEGENIEHQEITSGNYTASNPQFFRFQNKLYLTWFDNQYDSFSQRLSVLESLGWSESINLPNTAGQAFFGRPVVSGDDIFFFWQNQVNNFSSIVLLKPDRYVASARIIPLNYRAGDKMNQSKLNFELVFPEDPAGIKGYNFVLDQDPLKPLERVVQYSPDEKVKTVPLVKDYEGLWYLRVIIEDAAGNWSEEATSTLTLKTTPPGPVLFQPPDVDEMGYLLSNTFTISWTPTTDDTLAYAWRLTPIGALRTDIDFRRLNFALLSPQIAEKTPFASFTNLENGRYALSVAPVDEVGNLGQGYNYFFRLNKFRPFTRIDFVDSSTNDFSLPSLAIVGRGFLSEGLVDQVILDKNGKAPWSYTYSKEDFNLRSDRLIDQISLEDVEPGVYRVGVHHQERGFLFTGFTLKVELTGTVKIGDFSHLDQKEWIFPTEIRLFFSVYAIYFWSIFGFLLLIASVSFRQLVLIRQDFSRLERQARSLFDEKYYWARLSYRRTQVRKKGFGLRIKFIASLLTLTTTVILMLSLTLGFFITENSKRSLGEALLQRVELLLDSLVTGVKTYLPSKNSLELSLIPAQISAMSEARYTTITGQSLQDELGFSYVWASSDPDLAQKIGRQQFQPGMSKISDPIEEEYAKLQLDLNTRADHVVRELSSQVEELNTKALPYTTRTDAESQNILSDYQTQISRLQNEINKRLSELGRVTQSIPQFNYAALNEGVALYTFYKPIIYRSSDSRIYVRGLVRLQVSTENIVEQISQARNQLIYLTLLVSLAALVLGLVGALILSSLTINPIKKLVHSVETIHNTQDKSQLANHVIDIHTKDELDELATSINQMTQGLVQAAEANKDLLLGKETQKTFIPLDQDPKGRKMTSGYLDLQEAEIFGYYEGAKGVSGDYYDFRQLDNRDGNNPQSPWYGFIKCDVSGKGIVGALIMFTVASIIVKFFRSWTSAKSAKNIQLTETVADINDLLESLNFKGRFAALNMGIINVKTGKIRLCHAGDNIVHVFRGDSRIYQTLTLPGAPATGQIPDFMARALYKHFDMQLAKGDTLFFYTDGIEEAQRKFRDANYNVIGFDQNDPAKQVPLETDGVIDNEDIGPERINAILDAYYSRRIYQLVKKHSPRPDESLTFDFSDTDGSAKEAIKALVAIERIFRLVPDPRATGEDRIKIDILVVEFLQKHFREFKTYFDEGRPDPKEPEYLWFANLKEDEQFDDLTLLAIRKK